MAAPQVGQSNAIAISGAGATAAAAMTALNTQIQDIYSSSTWQQFNDAPGQSQRGPTIGQIALASNYNGTAESWAASCIVYVTYANA